MEIDYIRIGLRVREIRKSLDMSQADLSEAVYTSTLYISHIETAKKHPSLEMLVRIAEALNVTVDALLFGERKHDNDQLSRDMIRLMSECSSSERRIIVESACALIMILRKNHSLPDSDSTD